MANDSYHNSTGYFRDPGTEQDLTGNEERIVTCKSGEPFAWPMITLSNGEVVKLCSRLWNAGEKQCYKEYRNGGTSVKSERKPKEFKPNEPVTAKPKDMSMSERTLVKFDEQAAACAETKELIKSCNVLVGVAQVLGLTYALLTRPGIKEIYYVPRALISESKWRILNG